MVGYSNKFNERIVGFYIQMKHTSLICGSPYEIYKGYNPNTKSNRIKG